MAKTFAIIFGSAYLLVALAESLFYKMAGGQIFFTPVHNSVHWVAGAAGLVAYWVGLNGAKMYAKIFGVLFLLAFVVGITAPRLMAQLLGYPATEFYNVFYLFTGLVGIYTGFFSKDVEVVI